MPFNGSGVFSFVSNSWSPAVSATTIDSADWNTLRSDLATAISTAICKDGQTTITANLPMSTYRHTGVSNATALDQYATADQVVDNALCYGGASAAGTDTYAVNLAVSPGAYAAGQRYSFIADVANTGACTINFNTIGAASIKLQDGTDPLNGAIIADQIVEVEYNGTNMVLLNPDISYNPNQASTENGGTGIEDGANTWAKLADFIIDSSNDNLEARFVLIQGNFTPDPMSFTVSLRTGVSSYSTANCLITVHDLYGSGILSVDGLKLVNNTNALGEVVELWMKKNVNFCQFFLKEIAKDVSAGSINYYTNSVWQSADPGSGAAFEVVSAAGGALGVVETGGNQVLKTKVIDIGDWNMDTTASVSVAHGLTQANIRSFIATVRPDSGAGNVLSDLNGSINSSNVPNGEAQIDTANVVLSRVTGGDFDSTAYDSTSYNRGWITIQYV